jgi:imidazolonepropionase
VSQRLLFANAREIVTGASTGDDGVLRDHALLVEDGFITTMLPSAAVATDYANATRVDCTGLVLTPGFVDSHTHAVFGRTRAAEYDMRSRGLDYMEIARRGGGINASVTDVRTRSEQDLIERTLPRLEQAMAAGTTTIEIKSGYGLSVTDEMKMLRVIDAVSRLTPLDVVPTFLGAHDVPLDYRERRADYVRLITDEMIPQVADSGLARFCDVFMEPGAFTAAETRAILTAGRAHGLIPKLHADEFENSEAAELAVEFQAASADHLGAISDAGIRALADSDTVATLLPATLFFLGKKTYAPARRLIDAGVTVALASDFNPGTAPSPNMALVLTMACSQMGMTPLEAIVAATAGGARALRIDDVGRLQPGARADIVAWQVDTYVEIPYQFGRPPLAAVWKAGERLI